MICIRAGLVILMCQRKVLQIAHSLYLMNANNSQGKAYACLGRHEAFYNGMTYLLQCWVLFLADRIFVVCCVCSITILVHSSLVLKNMSGCCLECFLLMALIHLLRFHRQGRRLGLAWLINTFFLLFPLKPPMVRNGIQVLFGKPAPMLDVNSLLSVLCHKQCLYFTRIG